MIPPLTIFHRAQIYYHDYNDVFLIYSAANVHTIQNWTHHFPEDSDVSPWPMLLSHISQTRHGGANCRIMFRSPSEFVERRVWPLRRGLRVTCCHNSILCRRSREAFTWSASSQSASLSRCYTKICFAWLFSLTVVSIYCSGYYCKRKGLRSYNKRWYESFRAVWYCSFKG